MKIGTSTRRFSNKGLIFKISSENAEEAKAWYADLKVGDVLTFKYVYVRQETITHRIIDIEEKNEESTRNEDPAVEGEVVIIPGVKEDD